MYLLNAETEILWELSPTVSPLALEDLDLIIVDPIGERTYLDSPIEAARYTPPTETLPGSVSYLITPIIEGHWKVLLVTGIPSDYTILSKVEMFVFDNTTIVNPIKNTPLGSNGSIEVADDFILYTSYATKLIFSGEEFDVSETSGVVTIAISDYPVAPYRTVTDLLDALTNAIDDSQLTLDLRTRIEQIDGIGPSSVNARVLAVDEKVIALESAVADPSTGLIANASAINVIGTWVGILDDAIVAYAGDTSTFVTKVSGNESAIETQVITTDGLSAQFTVKVDINGYVSGFGFASTLNDDAPYSEFVILANKFTIAAAGTDPDAEDNAPFFHLTEETVVDGITVPPGTYMKSAYIADATITNAKIGNVIQSADAGVSWSIDKNGGIQARSIIIRDTEGNIILASDNTFSSLIANANIPIGVNLITGSLGYPIEGNWNNLAGTAAGSCILTIRDDGIWNPVDYPILEIIQDNDTWITSDYAATSSTRTMPVIEGHRYQISALMQCHRCTGSVYIAWLDKDKTIITYIYGAVPADIFTSGAEFTDFYEYFKFGVAPAGATFARVFVRKFATDDGETDSRLAVTHLMFAEVGETQTVPTPWTPGYDISSELSKGTLITGGGITLSGGGAIHSFDKDTFADTTPGVFMGWDDTESDYVLNIGDDSSWIKWDGNTLSVNGTITITNPADVRTTLNVADGATAASINLLSDPTYIEQVANNGAHWETVNTTFGYIGENSSAGARIDADGTVKDGVHNTYIPTNKGDTVYITARVYVSATFNGTLSLGTSAYDKDKSGLSSWPSVSVNASNLQLGQWQTISGQADIDDAATEYIKYRMSVRDNATTGYVIWSQSYLSFSALNADTTDYTASPNLIPFSTGYPAASGFTLGDSDGGALAAVHSLKNRMDPSEHTVVGLNVLEVVQGVEITAPASQVWVRSKNAIPVKEGHRYQFSVLTGAHRCRIEVDIEWYDADNDWVGYSPGTIVNDEEKSGGRTLDGYKELYVFGECPEGATHAYCYVFKSETVAPDTSTYLFATHFMFCEVGVYQDIPTPWNPGGDATTELQQGTVITGGGITLDSGGSIKGGQTDYATGEGFFLGYSSGNYKFSVGDATTYMKWAPSNGLEVSLGDTLQGISINAGGSRELAFYGDRGDGVVQGLANIGINVLGADNVVGWFGEKTAGTSNIGVYGGSYSNTAIYGDSVDGTGVYGFSTNAIGVYGRSWNANVGVRGVSDDSWGVYGSSSRDDLNAGGVQGYCSNGIGIYGLTGNGYGVYGRSTGSSSYAMVASCASSSGRGSLWMVPFPGLVYPNTPGHVASIGTLVTRDDGFVFSNKNGSTAWGNVGGG